MTNPKHLLRYPFRRPLASPILLVADVPSERPDTRYHIRRSYEPTAFDRVAAGRSCHSRDRSVQKKGLSAQALDARYSACRLISGVTTPPRLIHRVVKPGKVVHSGYANEIGTDQFLTAEAKTKLSVSMHQVNKVLTNTLCKKVYSVQPRPQRAPRRADCGDTVCLAGCPLGAGLSLARETIVCGLMQRKLS